MPPAQGRRFWAWVPGHSMFRVMTIGIPGPRSRRRPLHGTVKPRNVESVSYRVGQGWGIPAVAVRTPPVPCR
jgi:hypothetical protein